MALDLSKLNQEQFEAVTFKTGPLLLIAGAGTGKTCVITHRLAWLIQENLAKENEILALTFTDKAAEEMEDRVGALLESGYADLWVSTFHSFCQRALQENGLDIGLSPDFKLLDNTSGWLLMKQNFNAFKLAHYRPLGNPTKFIHALIGHFSRCKDQMIYPEDYYAYAPSIKADNDNEEKKRVEEIAGAYQTYQKLLLENNLLDFGDLINYALKLFKERPGILKQYQQRFKYFLVDEFQDTNWAQYQLIKLLSSLENNLTVSADDDQAIYRFRGASFSNVLQFEQDFPRAKKIVLTQNYRSGQNILDLAHQFIQNNNPNRLEHREKIDKRLKNAFGKKGAIEHLHFSDCQKEVDGIIDKIVEISNKNEEVSLNDFAILVRANSQAEPFVKGLERRQIPFQFLALRGLYGKPIILDTINYLKLLDNYHEGSAVYRALNFPFLNISVEDIARLTFYSRRKSRSLFETLQEASLVEGLSSQAIDRINFLLSLVKKHSSSAKQKSVSEIFVAFLDESGYLSYLAKQNKKENFDYLNQFFDKIKSFESSNPEGGLHNFMADLELELESGESGKLSYDWEKGSESIKLMTIHGAKGLEFEYVFIVNLVDRRFPSIDKKEPIAIPAPLIKDFPVEGDAHLQEERRLLYVAMTRAKKGLWLASAENYGGARRKKLSRFLFELDLAETEVKAGAESSFGLEKPPIREREARSLSLPKHFSFTQLKVFSTCPLQYKFSHLLRVPVKSRPAFSYGKSMHNTLYHFFLRFQDKKISQEELLKIYRENWIEDWYDNAKQKEEYFKKGKESLKLFFESLGENPSRILKIRKQAALEQEFRLKIKGETLVGKIDRIDELEQGVELIDYKTGSAKEKISSDDKRQLLIYQMACEEVFELRPAKLTYYYLDSGAKLSFLGSEKDKEKEKEKIIKEIALIKQSDFGAAPGWHCSFCDFKNICEFSQD